MQVKNALQDQCISSISLLTEMIEHIERANANLNTLQRQENLRTIESYKDEVIELEDLRDGHLTTCQLGTARRFLDNMQAWPSYGA